jgi:hypothetical protein
LPDLERGQSEKGRSLRSSRQSDFSTSKSKPAMISVSKKNQDEVFVRKTAAQTL